ncbi:MAG: hypothetical protein ACRDBM_04990 [Sporomusa sp.]
MNSNLPAESPCKTTLNLKEFTKFDARNSRLNQGAYIRICKDNITISAVIGQKYTSEDKVSLFINKKGNILVMQSDPSENGLKIRSQQGRGASLSKFIACRALVKHAKALGLELPLRFLATYDEELQAWVGRR